MAERVERIRRTTVLSRALLAGLLAATLVVAMWYARMLLRAASVLYSFSERTRPWVVRVYDYYSVYPERIEDLRVPEASGGVMALRVYVPEGLRRPPTILLVHGAVQPGNRMEEINNLAQALVRQGFRVVLPLLSEEANLDIGQRDVQTIADAIKWSSSTGDGEKVSVFGVSFGGALTVVAAGMSQSEQHVRLIVDLAGYNDLSTLALYYIHERVTDPDGHPYPAAGPEFGAVEFLKQYVDEMVAAKDVVPIQRAIARLAASGRFPVGVDDPVLAELTPEQREIFVHLELVDTPEVRQRYLDLIARHRGEFLALSPKQTLPRLNVPLYDLHATEDRQIPEGEVAWMRTEVRPGSDAHFLASPWLQHAMIRNDVPWLERLRVGWFVAELLSRAAAR